MLSSDITNDTRDPLILSALSIIVPILIYTAVLVAGAAGSLPISAIIQSPLFAVLVVLLLFPAYRLSDWRGTLASFSLTLTLFALLLLRVWNENVSSYFILGGFIPIGDSGFYYNSAQRLLEGNTFASISSYRPLFPGMLTTLLGLTGQDLQIALAIIVLTSAIACYFLARVVQQSHGTLSGLVVLVLLMTFYMPQFGTTMTENLGLALGAAGFALIWDGAGKMQMRMILLGFFILTLGLNARAGAFFVLPAMVLWGMWVFRGQRLISVPFLVGSVVAIVLGFAVNTTVLRVVGLQDSVAFSNFSYVLYGLASGGEGWRQVREDHPEVETLAEPERSERIYELAFERIRANPLLLMQGFLRALFDYLNPIYGKGAFSFIRGDALPFIIIRVLAEALAIWGVIHCIRHWREPRHLLMLLATLGILASVPMLPPIDTDYMRVYAATMPISMVLVVIGLAQAVGSINRNGNLDWLQQPPARVESSVPLVGFSIVLAVFLFAGPLITKAASTTPQFTEVPCPPEQKTIYTRMHPRSLIILDDSIERAELPAIRLDNFQQRAREWGMIDVFPDIATWGDSTAIMNTLNILEGRQVLLLADRSMLPGDTRLVRVCAVPTDVALVGIEVFSAVSIEDAVSVVE